MMKIRKLNFFYNEKRILHDISICFEPYRIHGIIGPNGAGKSTLLKNICRIWKPSSGTILINDTDYMTLSRKNLSKIVTMVPQNISISFPVTVYDTVSMGRHPHVGRFGFLSKKDRSIIENAMTTSGIDSLRNRNINELSGGECQLAIIARALATEAPFILLDEPTSDLDIRHALMIMELLCDLKKNGKTVLVNLHNLNFARRYCDTVTIIKNGGIYFSGSAGDACSEQNISAVFDVNMADITAGSRHVLYFWI